MSGFAYIVTRGGVREASPSRSAGRAPRLRVDPPDHQRRTRQALADDDRRTVAVCHRGADRARDSAALRRGGRRRGDQPARAVVRQRRTAPTRSPRSASVRGAAAVISVTRQPLDALDAASARDRDGRDPRSGRPDRRRWRGAITEELDPVVADLGDSLDECEEQIDGAPRLRAAPQGQPGARARRSAIAASSIPSARRSKSSRRCRCDWLSDDDRLHISAPPPIARRAWPRSWKASANAPR